MDSSDAWKAIEEIVEAQGLCLFDLSRPNSTAGKVKVFISKPGGIVSVDDCALCSKQILDHKDVEELIPGECTLEVSSPGINRRLRRDEHFSEAVGERIRCTYELSSEGSKETVRGTLSSFDGSTLVIVVEPSNESLTIAKDSVSNARIDFNFG